ncbi:HAD hydrolase-like protein [Kiritimatiellaeota bacterium B1221]|nr:HAD hydrolase-like protein [Kiritimatiellaeota bacterium B1221]
MPSLVPIWFDIDGTILHTRAGRGAFQKALRDTYGWQDSFESVVFAGNTDLQVLMDLSRVHAGDEKAGLKDCRRLFDCMADHLDAGLAENPPELVPGATELIGRLAENPHVLLGLVTGNARDCAFIKLKHVDLDVHFSEGGFGDQHADRNELARLAKSQLAAKHVDLAQGWIIGDTPRDIEAAKHIGARCLGVSCHFSPAELREAGADEVVEDLTPTDGVLNLLLGEFHRPDG